MKQLRWQLLIVFLALVAIGALLFGQQPVNVQPLEREPVTGGSYTEGIIGQYSRLNPVLSFYNPADRDINHLIFRSLLYFDDRGLPQPALAESWGISLDGTVYNFSLRTDAIWHDGNPVTSDDVLFTIDLLRNPDLPIPEDLRTFWDDIEASALDDRTLQFRLPEPFSPFLDYLTIGILPSHLLADLTSEQIINDPFNAHPIGSGPYRFERWILEDDRIAGVALTAFENYYEKRPFLDQIFFRYYETASQAIVAYQDGEIQGISQISADILPQALESPNLDLYTGRMPELSLIFLNLDNAQLPFFQDSSIRHALLMGLNRQWMVDHVLHSQATIADGPIFPNTWAYYENIYHVNYQPEQAIELIKNAGYTIPIEGGSVRANEGGLFLSFTLAHPAGEPYASLASAIQKNWNSLGFDIKLQAVPYQELIDGYLEARNYDAVLVDINLSQSPDPDPYPFWHQTQVKKGQNYAMWNDRQASEYLEQGRILVDPEERSRLYRNFQVRFVNEMPALPL
ncbi:MAG: peptide ABC transporter substrate-binding protein, partial [Anaerolineae bacterium]|nr:peptide ABC transporter substrate-binding protein [Anaerolineae bacterium]